MRAVQGSMAQWRVASRLARREVRRRPGRTLLVIMLVAVPVLAMTVGSIIHRTEAASDSFERRWPDGTDLVVDHPRDSAVDTGVLPEGTATSEIVGIDWAPIETSDGRRADSVGIWGERQLGSGTPLSITEGAAPATGEVWISEALRDELGIDVGDELSLAHPTGTWRVAGTGKLADDFDKKLLVIPDLPTEQFREQHLRTTTLVDLPGTPDAEALQQVEQAITDGWTNNVMTRALLWSSYEAENPLTVLLGWIAGAVALAAMGIIIAAAFATSARRQLVTIGQLSASGTSPPLLRRTLALQGSWTGLLGTMVGMSVGIVGVLATRGIVEQRIDHLLEPYRFHAADLAVIALTGIGASTIAALIPARSSAKVPVMAALAGRRPVGDVPRRLVPIGLGLFAGGILLLVVAATSEPSSPNSPNYPVVAASVIGALLVPAGMCCCSPLAVDAMSRATARIGRSWRFSGRSLARTRTRTAAVVTAIAVTGGIAIASSSMALFADAESDDHEMFVLDPPPDTAVVSPWLPPAAPAEQPQADRNAVRRMSLDVPNDIRTRITETLPDATWIQRRVATYHPAPKRERGELTTPDSSVLIHIPGRSTGNNAQLMIADPRVLDLYDLSRSDRAALGKGKTLVIDPEQLRAEHLSTELELVLPTRDGPINVPATATSAVHDFLASNPGKETYTSNTADMGAYLINEQTALDAGLDVVTRGAFIRNDTALTTSQQRALEGALSMEFSFGETYRDVPRPRDQAPGQPGWNAGYDYSDGGAPQTAIQGAILGAALLLTLIVVAIGLTLAAAEGRDERDVLVAVGARPATMRSMAAIKATVMTLTGALLAVPTAVLPVAIVSRAVDERFFMPWLAIGALVTVIPLLAGITTWVASNIAQRVRPVQMSTFAID